MEDRQSRLFLAVLLSLGVWMALNYFLFPTLPPPPKTAEKKETLSETVKPKDIEKPKEKETLKKVDLSPISINKSEIKQFYLATSSFLVQFSSLGGRIEKFYIRNYKDLNNEEVRIIKSDKEMIEFQGNQYKAIEISRGKGFDFNPSFTKDEIASSPFNTLNFISNFDEQNKTLTFQVLSPDKKYSITKEYKFFPEENYFKFKLTINNKDKNTIVLADSKDNVFFRSFGSLGPTRPGNHILEKDQVHYFRFYYLNGSFKDMIDGVSGEGFFSNFFGSKKTEEEKHFELISNPSDGLDFLGTGSRYFIAVLDPLKHKPSGVLLDNRKNNDTGVVASYDNITIESGKSYSMDFGAYVGIREADGMAFRDKTLNPLETENTPFSGLSDKLDKSFNQGLTTPFRNGIVWVLKKLYKYTISNYGWSIILFAILFKLAFYPLNQKQAESMKKMQELSPQIKEINERYAKDPTVKQQKIMELYKKNGTNPMSGCLPMVIQIPIFIALYTAFSDTIELWRTPFLWISDLSEPDTVYTIADFGIGVISLNILPLIMVSSQAIQTKMTSVSADPNQKTMMYLMPVIMLYFFWSMPSGVTLYWTLQNFLSIIQQVLTNKFGPESKKKSK
ncbi:MAG: membrane protein insertase YidC [Leptospiraceae bacterium]|nr:membrane protein insertase YidC [Leptospiraceae bacterium]MCK6380737.1 membrane protein insertase YidC [Leptospiraceae bacterium]